MGRLKYSHPLTLDDAASAFPDVQFVMCHFGNPFLSEAAAVMEKNPNVAADLSGLLDGVTELDGYFARQSGYVDQLRTWMNYVDDDSRFMMVSASSSKPDAPSISRLSKDLRYSVGILSSSS